MKIIYISIIAFLMFAVILLMYANYNMNQRYNNCQIKYMNCSLDVDIETYDCSYTISEKNRQIIKLARELDKVANVSIGITNEEVTVTWY